MSENLGFSGTGNPVLSNHSGDMEITIGRWLLIILLNERSAEIFCRGFLHYFHAAISNHLSEKPKRCLVLNGCLTQV